jgi:ribosomal protein S18 acetylase RimI-like enzyme
MGLPVVATDIRGCREVVDNGINGLLVPVEDPQALAQAITKLARSPELRKEMGKESIAKSAREFDERVIVNRVLTAQITTMREKGNFPRLSGSGSFKLRLRRADQRDVKTIARLHAQYIDTGFLRTLGTRFLEHLYSAMIGYPGSRVIVVDDPYGPIGFVAGVPDISSFYHHFVAKRGFRAGIASLRALIRPSAWRRIWETARYDTSHEETGAELLSMAVSPTYRGRNLGQDLTSRLLSDLDGDGVKRVKVVVGARNDRARAVYGSAGFVEMNTIEIHRGETSIVMVSDRT